MRRTLAPTVAAVSVAALSFLVPLARAGVLDPEELRVAELARRIAVHGLGAAALAVPGAGDTMPSLAEVGHPMLPVFSIALGFKLFGLHDWAGRLPLAAWGFVGVLATYAFVARLVDRRAGVYAAMVLSTMPLFFVQARTMLGDVVGMSAFAMSFGGLAVLVFGGQCRDRARWALLSVLGVAAGFFSVGAVLGVAVPLGAVGVTWMLTREPESKDRLGDGVAIGALLASLAACTFAALALAGGTPDAIVRWVGAATSSNKPGAFDQTIAHMGHALAPWSAFSPFAFGRLIAEPRCEAPARLRESRFRAAVLVAVALAIGAHGVLASHTGLVAFTAPVAIAVACAIAVRDFERGADASPAVGLGAAVLLFVLLHDFKSHPDKVLEPYAPAMELSRDGLAFVASPLWTLALGGFALIAGLAWFERESNRKPLDVARYVALLSSMRNAGHGTLAPAFGAVVAALLVAAATVGLGVKLGARWLPGVQVRELVMNAWWVVGVAPFALVFGANLAIDGVRIVSRRCFSGERGPLILAAGVLAGLLLSIGVYPALAAQLSPKDAFAAYMRVHKGDEGLGVLGVPGRSAAYSAGVAPRPFDEPSAAFAWLMDGSERRFLVIRAEQLGALNALYRARSHPRMNLPVLTPGTSEVALVASSLPEGLSSVSPLDSIAPLSAQAPRHRLDVDLEGKLVVIGFDLFDATGHSVDAVTPGRSYHLATQYEVVSLLDGAWQVFVHIDGYGRRHNGDHAPMGGKYPPARWLPGDRLVDDYELVLPPNFTPGVYRMYFGLYAGETRMKVVRGPQDGENRIDAGQLSVR